MKTETEIRERLTEAYRLSDVLQKYLAETPTGHTADMYRKRQAAMIHKIVTLRWVLGDDD